MLFLFGRILQSFLGYALFFSGSKRKYFSLHHPPIVLSAVVFIIFVFGKASPASLILIDDADCRD